MRIYLRFTGTRRPAHLDCIERIALAQIERRIVRKLAHTLMRFCPASTFVGFQHDISKDINAHSLVLSGYRWQQVAEQLKASGWRDENILVMPVPESDFWAYWNNTQLLQSTPAGDVDATATRESKAYIDYLVKLRVLVESNGTLQYRRYTDRSPESIRHAVQLYPFPSFASEEVTKNRDKILQVEKGLSDECSKTIYKSVLFDAPEERFKKHFANVISNVQYFEYLSLKPGDCIMNAGVSTGNEIPFLCAHLEGKGQIHCIDPGGFGDLSLYVRGFERQYQSLLHEHRYVLCDRSTGEPPAPLLGDFSGCTPIALDDLVAKLKLTKVDLIKMDLESMEPLALKGMETTITRFRPQLAIAVYHELEHFWELPLRIMQLCKDYDFYFNIYSPTHFEAIFYAIPKERAAQGSHLGLRVY